MKKISTQTITKAALLTACLCLSAYVSIPLGFTNVTLTLQTMIVNIIAIMLTPAEAFITIFIYILLGFIGVPVFSGGTGGPAKLFGPTGGYIAAFLISAPIMSFTKTFFAKLAGKFIKNKSAAQITGFSVNAVLIGMTLVYLLGSAYMKITTGNTWGPVLLMAVVPFIPLDIVKCIAASCLSVPVMRAIDKK